MQDAALEGASFSPRWQYRSFDLWDGAVTLSGAGVALTSTLLGPPQEPRWEGGVLFDAAVRGALRADSRSGRDRARAIGDTFYIGGALAPTLIDNLVVTLGVRGAPDVAAQMLLINLEAYAVAGALLIIFHRTRVVRPYASVESATRWATLLVYAQVGAGVVNIVLSAPAYMQVIHLGIATALWLSLVLLYATAMAEKRT